jgi:hypothetical protein
MFPFVFRDTRISLKCRLEYILQNTDKPEYLDIETQTFRGASRIKDGDDFQNEFGAADPANSHSVLGYPLEEKAMPSSTMCIFEGPADTGAATCCKEEGFSYAGFRGYYTHCR